MKFGVFNFHIFSILKVEPEIASETLNFSHRCPLLLHPPHPHVIYFILALPIPPSTHNRAATQIRGHIYSGRSFPLPINLTFRIFFHGLLSSDFELHNYQACHPYVTRMYQVRYEGCTIIVDDNTFICCPIYYRYVCFGREGVPRPSNRQQQQQRGARDAIDGTLSIVTSDASAGASRRLRTYDACILLSTCCCTLLFFFSHCCSLM